MQREMKPSHGVHAHVEQDVYAQDGVNVVAGDAFSSYAGKVCKATASNNSYVLVHDMTAGKFRWPRGYSLRGLPEGYVHTTVNDGIGTKVEIHDAAQTFTRAARDVIAMTWSDITRYGGMPLVFTSVLDVDSIGEPGSQRYQAAQWLIDGLADIAKEQHLVVFNGETAELWSLIGTHNMSSTLAFNRAGTMEGVYHPEKMILGDGIQNGDIVIALQEQWFRSNGSSSVRKAFALKFGDRWHSNPHAKEYIRQAAAPSVVYDRFLCHLNGWTTPDHNRIIDVHGLVHLSWWSFEGKLLDDVLVWRQLDVVLDTLCAMPSIMYDCAQWRGMSDSDVYRTWHGGQGMLAFVSPHDVDTFLKQANIYNVNAQVAWHVKNASAKSSVVIHSRYNKGEKVVFAE